MITLICPQKTQSESFVLIYERLKVIIWICLPIHIQNTNSNHNNCFSLLLRLEFVFWILIGKQIQIITFNHSYINTNDSDCLFCGHIRVILYSISLQYKCIWPLNKLFKTYWVLREIWELSFLQFCFI